MMKDVQGILRRRPELEVGTRAHVGHADGQLARDLVPEEHDLDSVVLAVCEFTNR
jgi:hypothetical protein